MTIYKYYCDLCGKQLENVWDFEHLEFNYKGGGSAKFEVCRACFYKVRDYAYQLKMERRTDE